MVEKDEVHGDEAAMAAITKCSKDNNIKMETLMKACDEDVSAVPGFKCFTKCVQLQMGIMDEAGKFSPEGATAFVAAEDKELAVKVSTECAKEVASLADHCERASATDECMRKKEPAIYKKSCLAILTKIMT